MNKRIIIAGLMLVSVAGFAQKREIKKAEKAMVEGEAKIALEHLAAADKILAAADNQMKSKFYVIKAEALTAVAGPSGFDKLQEAFKWFGKSEDLDETGEFSQRIADGRSNLRAALVNSAIVDQNSKNYSLAAEKLRMSYLASPKDTADLYYAAGNAVNGQDFDTALAYYKELLDMGFTDKRTDYVSVDPDGQEITHATENDRDNAVLAYGHTDPVNRAIDSKKGDMLQKVTLILINKGETEEALAVMKEARAANPNDLTLIRSEADIAYKMGDMEKYDSLMNEIVEADPNNPELFYNLGVSAGINGQKDKAMNYYKRALELDPNFANAQVNIAALMLGDEGKIVEEMNNLGMSSADERRYDVLKNKRTKLYQDVMPYLESAVKLKPENIELVRTLMNVYSQLGKDTEFKAMKAKLQTLGGE
ncbi:MAG: tetratricopeptide repeat protein [Bacteroidetes bacterium]|nr:tetratricopeptide repeat protein [Bacteroidota bacterium]